MESHLFLVLLVTLQLCSAQNVLPQRDYTVDITYQPVRGDDPILHFNIRTYVARSTYTYLEYNISGHYHGESYSNSGTASVRTSLFRTGAEHMWHHEFQEEDMHRGDTILYRIKVKVDGLWHQSIMNRAIVGEKAPTSRENWLSTYSTTTTASTTTQVTTTKARTPPPPPPAPTPSPTRAPSTTTTTSAQASAPANEQPQLLVPRRFLPASRQPPNTPQQTTKKPSASDNKYKGQSKLLRKRRDDSDEDSEDDTGSKRWSEDIADCLRQNEYNIRNCSNFINGRHPNSPGAFTPASPESTRKQSTVAPTDEKNGHGNDEVMTANGGPGPSPKDGDLTDSQANSAGEYPVDITIIMVATAVPAVIMIGLIVIVTIVMKNRRTRAEPDPYQQVFNNMNYSSTMEIGGRPGLPPPRAVLQKPTEETEYAYAETQSSPNGDIYEAITHVDYELNGKMMKPRPPSMSSSGKSTITPHAATEWGSDEYEDPTSPSRTSLKVCKNSMSTFGPTASRPTSFVAPNPTYTVDIPANPRNTLASTTVNNIVYNDTYQDPAVKQSHTLPANINQAPEHIYSDTYQDPDQSAPTSPPAVTEGQDPAHYEVPDASNDQQGLSRQYSALRRDESGVTLY